MKYANRIEVPKQKSIYQLASETFGVSYNYCHDIASGRRKAIRGKAKDIKDFLIKESKRKKM